MSQFEYYYIIGLILASLWLNRMWIYFIGMRLCYQLASEFGQAGMRLEKLYNDERWVTV